MPNTDKEKKTGHASLVARVGVAVVAIAWVLRGQDWQDLGEVFQKLHLGYFALSLATYALAQLVIAARWWLLLRAQSIHIPILATFRLHFLGLFYNNVMPSSVGGDLLKAWYVTKHTEKRLEGALSVLIDRVVGLGGMVLMAAASYLLFLRGRSVAAGEGGGGNGVGGTLRSHQGMIVWFLAGATAVVVGLLVYPGTRGAIGRVWGRIAVRGAALLGRARTAIVVYCSKPLTMFLALLLTLVGQTVVVTAFWLLGRNLGIVAEAKYYFVIFPIAWVVAAIPVSVGGLGVLEAGVVTLFTSLTPATAESALALALCQRFIWMLTSLPGGVVHLLGGHLPSDFLVDGRNPVN